MKIIFDSPVTVLAAEHKLTEAVAANYRRFGELGARLSIYSFPVVASLWVWIVFPEVGLPEKATIFRDAMFMLLMIGLLPVAHELLHLLALPGRLLRSDTRLFIDVRQSFFRIGMAARIGGKLSREQFVWVSVLPFLVLTGIPFAWALLAAHKPSLIIGLAACLNFSLASVDLMQVYLLLRHVQPGRIISGGN